MTAKTRIVEHLGDRAVLLPSLIGDALAANDRIKLRLSLLQEAALQAASPGRQLRRFDAERRAAGLDDPAFDALVADARLAAPDRLHAPGITALVGGLGGELDAMLAPLQVADAPDARMFGDRVAAAQQALPAAADDQIALAGIDALTAAGARAGLHRLVMDLHRALNRLAADSAVETLDGAQALAIGPDDRAAVRAFMGGLNRTAPLAFGHPGLGTTAVRAGGRLVIQNDIGTTDAHVLVVHVEANTVTVTYTDIHRPRAAFFIALFDGQAVGWSPLAEQRAEGLEEDVFYLVTGRHDCADAAARDRFLDFLGSRIVFLIDWNKARKALQTFDGKNAAIALLTWAAARDYGHRAFLDLGGIDLISDAVHRVAAGRIPYGVRLDVALGVDACTEFLQGVLRDTSQGLAAGRTARLIRDEIQADLARRFESAESAVLTALVRHLGLSRMLASSIADLLGRPGLATPAERQALARRAKRLEEKGDRLALSTREVAARIREAGVLRTVIDEVEDTADALEECAWLMSLMPDAPDEAAWAAVLAAAPLVALAGIVTDSLGQMVRAVEAASRLPDGRRADAAASLQAIDAVVLAERRADEAQRRAFASFMAEPAADARALVLAAEIARALEVSTDHLSHAALSLRDRVLEELSA